MSTLIQAASVNGRVISNNDPDMVIVLDSNPGVQISSIQDDSITYAFIGEVTEDTVYSLNLTFTYKQKHKLIVPVQLTHKNIAVAPELNEEWITVQEDIIPAASNAFIFKLVDENGDPVTDAVRKTIAIESVPKYAPQIVAGYSNTLTIRGEGLYSVSGNIGHVAGQVTIELVLTRNGVDYTIPTKTFDTPGTPVNITLTPDTLNNNSKTTEVTIEIRQDVYAQPNKLMTGRVTSLTLTGGATNGVAPFIVTDGIGKFDVTTTNLLEDISIAGVFAEPAEEVRALPRNFTGSITVVEEPTGPTVTNLTDDISLKLWESTIVNYDVMLGDVNINSSITDVVLELTEEIKADLEFVKQEDGFWNVKAIHGQTTAIFWTIPGNIYVTHQGNDYILPISVKVTVEGNDGSIPVNRFDVTFL